MQGGKKREKWLKEKRKKKEKEEKKNQLLWVCAPTPCFFSFPTSTPHSLHSLIPVQPTNQPTNSCLPPLLLLLTLSALVPYPLLCFFLAAFLFSLVNGVTKSGQNRKRMGRAHRLVTEVHHSLTLTLSQSTKYSSRTLKASLLFMFISCIFSVFFYPLRCMR
jgi:hypothetical protein